MRFKDIFNFKARNIQNERPRAAYTGYVGFSFFKRNAKEFALEGYIKNVIAFAAIHKIALAASSIEIKACRTENGKKKILDEHPILDLLYNPNPITGGKAFIEALMAFRLISGNTYITRVPDSLSLYDPTYTRKDPPSELWLMRPDLIDVKMGKTQIPEAYLYRSTQGQKTYRVDPNSGKCDLLQIKTFHPLNEGYGLSPMEAAAYSIDIFNTAQKWNKALLDNSGRPPGAFTMETKDGKPDSLTDDQYLRLKEEISTTYSGAMNAGRPLLLEGGLKYQEMGINPKDMDYDKGLLSAARFVSLAYGVPPMLMNIPGDATYANYQEAKTAFWHDTVLTEFGLVLEELNRWLPPMYGDKGLYLSYDEDSITALESIRAARYERANNAEFITIDEKRAMVGLDPYKPTATPGGTLLISSSMIPLDLVGEIEPTPPEDTRGNVKE